MTSQVNPKVAEAIREVLDRFESALQKRDSAGIAALFTEQAVYQYTGVPLVVGRDAIDNFYHQAFSAFPKSEDAENDMSVKMTSTQCLCETATIDDPHMVVDYGTALGKGPSPTGGMMILHQIYTVVFVKEQGEWKIRIAATNLVGDQSGKVPEYLISAMNGNGRDV